MMDVAAVAPPSVAAVDAPPSQPVVMEFSDSTGVTVGGSMLPTELDYVDDPGESLDKWLSRPVLVVTRTWASTAFAAGQYDPWTTILSNPVIKNKISNYSMIRATLHIRATFDGTPLQAGALQMAYTPSQVNQSGEPYPCVPQAYSIYRGSQFRNVEIYGSGSSSGEIVAPFFFPNPFASIVAGNTDVVNLGRIRLQQIVPLTSSSNAAVVAGTVQIFAWLTDVQLRVSTFLNAMHRAPHAAAEAKPNFNISRPATVISKAASMLSGLPIVGPYATAASIVAGKIATAAAAFGFSRPFDLTDKHVMIPRYVGGFALTEGVDSPEKLSTDPKQGISMGTAWAGLPGEPDPMSIASIVSREAMVYVDVGSWTTSTAVGTLLYSNRVYPHEFNRTLGTDTYEVTPLSYATAPFKYWTGSIRLRIKAIAAGMSRGRLLIWHYPHNDTGYTTATVATIINTCQCCMLDLEGSTDVEFDIKPSMTRPWLSLNALGNTGAEFNGNPTSNGYILVTVANALSAPLASSVGLIYYVRGGPDYQVAVPALSNVQHLVYNNQMDRGGGGAVDSSVPASGPGGSNAPNTTCALSGRGGEIPVEPFFGERIESFRSLAKRFCLYALRTPVLSANSPASTNMSALMIVDDFYGWPNTVATAAGAFPWTWVTYSSLPFLATRGGMRYRAYMNALPGAPASTMTGARFGFERCAYNLASGVGHVAPGTSFRRNLWCALLGSGDGQTFTPAERQPVTEAEFPYYSPRLFTVPGSKSVDALWHHPDGIAMWATYGYPAASTAPVVNFDVYHAAADDFSCMEWIGVGSIYTGNGPPLFTATLASY